MEGDINAEIIARKNQKNSPVKMYSWDTHKKIILLLDNILSSYNLNFQYILLGFNVKDKHTVGHHFVVVKNKCMVSRRFMDKKICGEYYFAPWSF